MGPYPLLTAHRSALRFAMGRAAGRQPLNGGNARLKPDPSGTRLTQRSVAVDATRHDAVIRIPAQAVCLMVIVWIGLWARR